MFAGMTSSIVALIASRRSRESRSGLALRPARPGPRQFSPRRRRPWAAVPDDGNLGSSFTLVLCHSGAGGAPNRPRRWTAGSPGTVRPTRGARERRRPVSSTNRSFSENLVVLFDGLGIVLLVDRDPLPCGVISAESPGEMNHSAVKAARIANTATPQLNSRILTFRGSTFLTVTVLDRLRRKEVFDEAAELELPRSIRPCAARRPSGRRRGWPPATRSR